MADHSRRNTMANPVTLGNLHFDTQVQALDFFKAMLARYQAGDIVNDDDAVHLHHLIERHVEAPQKIGCGIARFYVDMTPKGTRCFWLERTDGSCTDFSYISCIRAKAKSLDQAFKEACREAVAGDLMAAKQDHFEKYSDETGRVPCDITGELLLPHECHLDHAHPMTFEVIVTTFREATGVAPGREILSASQDQQFATTFTDPGIAQRFRNFHHRVANLRIVKSGLNLSLGASQRMRNPKHPVVIR
jgi:hypothetical protein